MITQEINWKNLPGPESITRSVLANGITVLSFPNNNVSSVYMVGLLNCGSAFDPLEKLGLAHFTANMLSRGTARRNFKDYHLEIENRGASLMFSAGSQQIWFRGKALAEDLEVLVDLASDSLRQPAFPQEYFERFRSQLLAGLAIRDQDTEEMASLAFDLNLFPDHPYGQPQDGYPNTIQNITRQDLIQFHRDYFSPEDMIVVITGAVAPKQAVQFIDKYFSDWSNPNKKDFQIPPIPGSPRGLIRRHRHIDDKSQADLIMGTIGPRRVSEDFLPIYLGNNILGQFGLMGRIGESVRTRSGLAYHASSSLSAWSDSGTWEFTAGTNSENLEKTIELTREEIRRFVTSPVTQEELEDSQSHLIGRMPLSLESNAGLANAILTMERFQLGLDYYQHYAQMLTAINAEIILAASKKYLDADNLVIASAGPGDDIL